MNHPIEQNSNPYTATTVVSPMMLGEEAKNQDRVRWSGPDQTACLGDGVTSSPHADKAAELAVSLAPGLFKGNTKERLSMLCDLLTTRRQESLQEDITIPEHIPKAMRSMLQKAIQSKMEYSHQTTLVAAQFTCDKHGVNTRTVKCGDSGFFAFSPESGLLFSSVRSKWINCRANAPHHRPGLASQGIQFGPGDDILVTVEGCLSQYKSLAKRTDLKEIYRPNWLVCRPVEVSHNPDSSTRQAVESRTLFLSANDRLLVPRYLWGQQLESKGKQYRLLRYASAIKPVVLDGVSDFRGRFDQSTSATQVLPDHFQGGHFDYVKDRFPPGTHFVLCSDGFYNSFCDAGELWTWLKDHAKTLLDENERQPLLEQLHRRLDRTAGDDDISFVWVYPKSTEITQETIK